MEFVSHCIKRNRNGLEERATAGMLIIFLVVSLLGWIYLTQASQVASTSRRNQELEREKVRLQQENMELMVEIAAYESVGRLAVRAEELGFVAVAPEGADFVALAPGVSQGAQGAIAQAHAAGGQGRPGPWPGVGGSEHHDASSGDATGSRSALGGYQAQFAAWVRANEVRSRTE